MAPRRRLQSQALQSPLSLLGIAAALLLLASDDSSFPSFLLGQRRLGENLTALDIYDKSFYRTAFEQSQQAETLTEPLSALRQNIVPFFIHVFKSGGSTILNYYRCFGVVTAGIRRTEDGKAVLKMDSPKRFTIEAPLGQLVSGGGLWQAASGIYPEYTGNRKGRGFAVFRNPVERLVSLYYYLQVATWEKGYDEDLGKKMSLVGFATNKSAANALYRTLITGQQIEEDEGIKVVKTLLKEYVLVGLTDRMTESFNRFDTFLGYATSSMRNDKYVQCKRKYWKQGPDDAEYRENKNDHPPLDSDSEEWRQIAEANAKDMELYAYIQELFVEQGKYLEREFGWEEDHHLMWPAEGDQVAAVK